MRAWLLESIGGGLKNMSLGRMEDPDAEAGEVIVRVKYAALNPADRYLAEGQYPAKPHLPHVLGRDGAGEVVEIGENVTSLRVGDHVVVLRSEVGVTIPGTLAEYVAVPADLVAKSPDGWTQEESAAAPLVYLTAHQALTQWGTISGKIVLVTGATGGVGVASVHLGKAMGARMLGMSRDEEKAKKLISLGAEAVFDPQDAGWRKKAREFLHDKRVDLAIDNIGGKLLPEVIDMLGDRGTVSAVGRLAGPVPEFNTASLFFRRIRIGGVAVGACTAAESQAAWKAIVATMNQNAIRPVVDRVYEFEDVPDAFKRLSVGPMGKIVIRVGD